MSTFLIENCLLVQLDNCAEGPFSLTASLFLITQIQSSETAQQKI